MPPKKETLLVKKIKAYLDKLEQSYFFKIHGGPMQMSGISDLIGVYKGRFYAIEVKTEDNKRGTTRLQEIFLEIINNCGGVGFVATSVEEVKEKIN